MKPAPRKPSVRLLLSRLTRSIETFRHHREEAPLHMLVVFLIIAQRKGIGAGELVRLTGLSPASISRNVHSLGRGKGDGQGLGLVTQIIDESNPRAHLIKLTAKGATLARELAGTVQGEGVADPATAEAGKASHLHWQHWID